MDVIERVLLENWDDTLRQLKEAQNSLESGRAKLPQLEKEIAEAKQEMKHIKKQHTARPSNMQRAQRKCECLQQEKKEKEEYLKQCRYEVVYCQHYLDKRPLGEAPEWAAFALGELPHQPVTPMVDPIPGTEGSASSGSPTQPRVKMWRCKMTSLLEQLVVKEPLVETTQSTKKTRLCLTRKKCLRLKSSVT